jgi:hypothetical protein
MAPGASVYLNVDHNLPSHGIAVSEQTPDKDSQLTPACLCSEGFFMI